jgi:Rieske Fe-S protein
VNVKDRTVLTLEELERITRRQMCTAAATGLVALVVPSCMGFVIGVGGPEPAPGGSDGAADGPGRGGRGGAMEAGNRGPMADAGSAGVDARRNTGVPGDARPSPDTALRPDAAPVSACSMGFNTMMAPSAFAMGTATFFEGRKTFVCRDAGGLFAVTSVCTHQGCDVRFVNQGSGFSCPCHGSRFDFAGAVTNGPAGSPLRHYDVCIGSDGRLWFDTARVVTRTVRLQA